MVEQCFETLKVWQKSHALILDIHKRLLPNLLQEEKYGLTDQLKRSSKSVLANNADGDGCFTDINSACYCPRRRGRRLKQLVV